MRTTKAPLAAALIASLLVACDDATSSGSTRDAGTGSDAGDSAATKPFRVATFNAAFVPTTKGAKERLPLSIKALEALDADVLCLQEAFNTIAPTAEVAARLNAAYPYAHSTGSGPMTSWGNGVLLLSKQPLANAQALAYANNEPGGLVARVLLTADLRLGDRTARIACTHLSAGLSADEIDRKTKQVDELFAFLDGLAKVDGPTFLLGDFNAGPDPIGACTTSSEPPCDAPDLTTYDRVLTRFQDPSADLKACTQCKRVFDALQVVSNFSTEPDQRIDHCFVSDLAPYVHVKSQIVLDADPMLEVAGEVLHSLSDHRGLACDFAPPGM